MGDQMVELVREYGWVSGPSVAALLVVWKVLRWLLKELPAVELTEPARSLIASLTDHADNGWTLHDKCSNYLCRDNLIVDVRDGEIFLMSGEDKEKLGHPEERQQLGAAAKKRQARLVERDRQQKLDKVIKIMSGGK